MQALKESKKTSKRQPGTGGSSEGTSRILVVPDEKKISSEPNVILEWGSDQEKHAQDDDEETDDEFVHGDDQVNDDEDEEMTNAEVEESGFVGNVKDTTDIEINSLLDVKIHYEVPHIQSSSVLTVHVSVIYEPSVLTPIPKTPSVAPTTTLLPPLSVSTAIPTMQQETTPIPTPPIIIEAPSITTVVLESDTLTVFQLRVAKLEQDVFELKKINHSIEALATLKSKVPMVVALESSKTQTPTVDLDQEFKKSPSEILKIKKEQAEKKKMPKYTIKSTDIKSMIRKALSSSP
ncbi:hypothetical protein Tco_0777360 [Tanacetum coccineum]